MMEREYRFYSEFQRKEDAIVEFAENLNNAFYDFSKYDQRFGLLEAHLPGENKIIKLVKDGTSVLELAEAILDYNKMDIKKYDRMAEPNIYYKRPFGFSFGFNFRDCKGQNIFSLRLKYGGVETAFKYQMNETPIKQVETFNMKWYIEFFRSITSNMPIKYAVIRPKDSDYLHKVVTKYKYPLGLLTYFNNEDINFDLLKGDIFSKEISERGLIYCIKNEIFDEEKALEELYSLMNLISQSDKDYLV